MTTTACPRPDRCRAATHQVGSLAARACSAAAARPGGPPPPPPPPTVAAAATWEEQLEALKQTWAQRDELFGWTHGAKAPHPRGGYTSRTWDGGQDGPERWAAAHHREVGPDGWHRYHRTDGPAKVNWDWQGQSSPQITSFSYYEHGLSHRGDGPAMLTTNPDTGRVRRNYCWRGRQVVTSSTQGEDLDDVIPRLGHLTSLGAARQEQVGWLAYERDLHQAATGDPGFDPRDAARSRQAARAATEAVLDTGVGVDLALDLLARGVSEPAAVLAVATRRAPASWAGAAS